MSEYIEPNQTKYPGPIRHLIWYRHQ